MNRIFPAALAKTKPSKLDNITLRGWGGGLNGVANDKAMEPRFLKTALNVRRTASGTQKVRYGHKWISDVASVVNGNIIDMHHFNNRNIAVTAAGEVAAINAAGTPVAIWNETIANALSGSPAGWGTTYVGVDFVPFKRELIIHNGVDKPITINSDFETTYLQDLATGSNVNVPIGKYGCVVSNYHCVAGIALAPTTIYISNVGTAGTFPGDAPPNDAISIDVGAYAPDGAAEIRGIAGFRNKLIVHFEAQSLIVELGNYVNDVHVPQFPDTLPQFGLLGHRCISAYGNDLTFAGFGGIASAKRNLFSSNIDSDYLSDIVEPLFRNIVEQTDTDEIVNAAFMVFDPLAHDLFLFPSAGNAFVYSANDKLRYRAWSQFETPEWSCGCVSTLGRTFFAKGTRVYQMGNGVYEGEDYAADMLLDRDETWMAASTFGAGRLVYDSVTQEVYEALVAHESGTGTFLEDRTGNDSLWVLYEGEEIGFRMEMPWLDGKDPMKTKQLRFVSLSTTGTAPFTLEVYVDDLHDIMWEDPDNPGVQIAVPPAITMDFVGNNAIGAGGVPAPYGGGRRSGDPRLKGFPVKFNILKPIVYGSVREPLEFETLSFLYSKGRYKR